MKKLIALLLALVMVIGLVACGETTPDVPEGPEEPEINTPETTEGTEASEENEENVEPTGVMSYADYVAAPLDTEVSVETYIQAVEGWWDGYVQLYTQNEEGAYYIYNLACTEEEAAQLVPGTHIRVTGYKIEWSGEIEISDATYEILDDNTWFVEEAVNVTELAAQGNEALAEKMNHLVQIDNLTVVASKDANGNDVPYLYKWDGSGSQGDDLYFNVQIGEQVYTFTVNVYMLGTGADSDVYKAVEALQIGDTITVGGFLYWYNGAQPHVTHLITAE